MIIAPCSLSQFTSVDKLDLEQWGYFLKRTPESAAAFAKNEWLVNKVPNLILHKIFFFLANWLSSACFKQRSYASVAVMHFY